MSLGFGPEPHDSTLAARAIIQTLIDHGVEHIVLCSGSRSAPLAFAAASAEDHGFLTLHVRTDERAAAFVALGIGKRTGTPAAVITTSGTAVANLSPAVLEARESRVPLILVTADRPPYVRRTWANQCSPLQPRLLSETALFSIDLACFGEELATVADVTAEAIGASVSPVAGPVHINCAFDEPLTPHDEWFPEATDLGEWETEGDTTLRLVGRHDELHVASHTVIVCADGMDAESIEALTCGLPVFAEPTSGVRAGAQAISAYRLLLDSSPLAHKIQQVVVFGRPTLSRPVSRLIARDDVKVTLVAAADRPGPGRLHERRRRVTRITGDFDADWTAAWVEENAKAQAVLDTVGESYSGLTGIDVARCVAEATTPTTPLVVAASNPIRDLDLAPLFDRDSPGMVTANRGLAGIDGTIATAWGVAVSQGSTARVLLGDLAFLHDSNALNIPEKEREWADLQIVCFNDDGGGIFHTLEYGHPRFDSCFERLFGTPHGTRFDEMAAAFGVAHTQVDTISALREALACIEPGLSVVEVKASRQDRRELMQKIQQQVMAAVAPEDAIDDITDPIRS